MRTVLALIALAFVTPYYVFAVIFGAMFGVKDKQGGIYRRAPKMWGRWMCRAAGARIVTHGIERLRSDQPRVIISNHVSWFDVFTLANVLPRCAFMAKGELRKIPFFGLSMERAGQLFVDRKNRKTAFAQYDDAAARIRAGATVAIFPEGTRGFAYPLRPFKKGPFVLAISAGVPIVPVLIHGSLEVLRKGTFRVRSNTIHVHVLDDIPTAGLTYDDRGKLAERVYETLRTAQRELYGIDSPPWSAAREPNAVASN